MMSFRGDDTSAAVNQAITHMNKRGGQEGHVVTTTNDTQRLDIFCAVISWSAILEDQIENDLRPTGCSCTIF